MSRPPPPPNHSDHRPSRKRRHQQHISLFTPFYALLFLLLHLGYHLYLSASSSFHFLDRIVQQRRHLSISNCETYFALLNPKKSSATLHTSDGASGKSGYSQRTRVPHHLAVVLAPTPPSFLGLSLSLFFHHLFSHLILFVKSSNPFSRYSEGSPNEKSPSFSDWLAAYRLKRDAIRRESVVRDLCQIVRFSGISGVEEISAFDESGILKANLKLLGESLRLKGCTMSARSQDDPTPPSSSAHEAVRLLVRVYPESPFGPVHSLSPDCNRTGTGNARVQPSSIKLTLLSSNDGATLMAKVASRIAHSTIEDRLSLESVEQRTDQVLHGSNALDKAKMTRWRRAEREKAAEQVTVTRVDDCLREQGGISEPQLLIVRGGRPNVQALYNFPAWPTRLTEIYYSDEACSGCEMSPFDFHLALRHFSKSEQRYGR
ncbi:hypothetical protein IE53DRAFT_390748 [Violaceomyces palustris]|uniref:Uncharacterized protein n=1 Tax=Violaceomyces palustris TaxID=1673888 RepID=A0ACD0NMU8_9BASI|nr:hypothetical protein IE53DRAFT_390748 [Violaceomyces palustris]